MFSFKKLCLTSINRNVDMRCRMIKKCSICRSGSTVVGIMQKEENEVFTLPLLNKSCEVTQSQRIFKEALALSNSLKNRLKCVPRSVQQVFVLDKLAAAMSGYENVICYAEHTKLNNIYSLLCDPCFLFIAYTNGFKKYAVAGLADVSSSSSAILSDLCFLSKELFFERYKPILVRKLYLDKSQIGKSPLSVQSIRDKVVQRAVQMLIQSRFDSEFSDCSHGFHSLKSCHTALNDIYWNGKRTSWFIELSLLKTFNKIHHLLLMKEMGVKVADQRMLNLVREMLKVGYVNLRDLSDSTLESNPGIFPGSVLSSLFANILCNRIDKWVECNLLIKFNTLSENRINLADNEAVFTRDSAGRYESSKFTKERASDVSLKKIRAVLREIRKQQAAQNQAKCYVDDLNYRKLWYVRYAYEMLLGLTGPKKDALEILKGVKIAVIKKLKMRIHPNKSRINHHSDGVFFLGYRLLGNYDIKSNYSDSQVSKYDRIKFSVPIKKLLKRYRGKGFMQWAKKGNNIKYVARRVDKWIFIPGDFEVVKVRVVSR